MDDFAKIAEKIIEEQAVIVGPVAIEQAKQVSGITVDWSKKQVSISGDEASVIDHLVEQYKKLFGQISVEVCKEAAAKAGVNLSPEQLPKSLR